MDGDALLDLDYSEDSRAEVDANVVMSGDGGLVEVQATAERMPVSRASFDDLLALAEPAIEVLRDAQEAGDGRRGRRGARGEVRRVVATRNEHKLRELREILTGVELLPLPADVELPPEDAETFAENALDKARAAHVATGLPAIADDSGIAASALGGRPGPPVGAVRGPGRDRRGEPEPAPERARGQGRSLRRLRCALAYVDADGNEELVEGRCEGTLAEQPRGTGGFGYDPAFVPADTGPTTIARWPSSTRTRSTRSATGARARRRLAEVLVSKR